MELKFKEFSTKALYHNKIISVLKYISFNVAGESPSKLKV